MGKENVIYISSHGVQLISGSNDKEDMIKVDAFREYPLAEGAMINGVITDDTPILEILKEMRSNRQRTDSYQKCRCTYFKKERITANHKR